jgi:hypothetical protein
MRRVVTPLFEAALDSSHSLGVGWFDTQGFLIHAHGPHQGFKPEELVLHFPRQDVLGLESFVQDLPVEYVLIGQKYSFYIRFLPQYNYLVYAMVASDKSGGKVRFALRELAEALQNVMHDSLFVAVRQRLEQPRQFLGGSLIR